MYTDSFTQVANEGQEAPFEAGVSSDIGGEFHVDGTPMRLCTMVVVGVLVLIVFQQTGFRFHVTV